MSSPTVTWSSWFCPGLHEVGGYVFRCAIEVDGERFAGQHTNPARVDLPSMARRAWKEAANRARTSAVRRGHVLALRSEKLIPPVIYDPPMPDERDLVVDWRPGGTVPEDSLTF